MHTPLAQQPFGHDASLQVHVPPSHTVPAPQGGLVPHMHVPVAASQVSALVAGQATQATPRMPHVLADRAWHPLAEQQPFGHETESHTQLPPTQRLPVPQAGWLPQLQVPAAEQMSARAGAASLHAAIALRTHRPPAAPAIAARGAAIGLESAIAADAALPAARARRLSPADVPVAATVRARVGVTDAIAGHTTLTRAA